MTFSLFTDAEFVNNHLKAGDLDVTLERTKLTSTYLTDRGFLTTAVNDQKKDFSNNTDENVFGLDGALIVPLSEYEAEMVLTNNSDVAFNYWIQIVTDEKSGENLAEQLEVTVTIKNEDGTTQTKRLAEGLWVGSASDALGVLAVGEDCEFSVNIKFLDDRSVEEIENNDAQGESVYFDLVVYASQYVGEDPNPIA